MTLTINQATSLTLTIILFVGVGGLNAEGYQFLSICVASAVRVCYGCNCRLSILTNRGKIIIGGYKNEL